MSRNLFFFLQNKWGIMKKLILFFLLGFSTSVYGAQIETEEILLRGVDKVTGRVSTFQGVIGETIHFGNLKIIPERCVTRSPEETPENAAFLSITERTKEGDDKSVFYGWMFSSNPAFSAMEHPIYDIWVLKCIESVSDISSSTLENKTKKTDLSAQPTSSVQEEQLLEEIAKEENPALGEEDVLDPKGNKDIMD